MASKGVTIRDVARRAGVSVATVSNVLNGQKKVRSASFERVTEAARELNYRADPAAAWLRSGRSRVIATLSPNLENPFFSGMVAAVERLCHEQGYELFLASSDNKPDVEAARIRSLLQWRPAAFFVIPCVETLPLLDEVAEAGVPVVIADRALTDRDCDFIELDNHQAGALAARHLIDLGHRRIGLINGFGFQSFAWRRETGYAEALAERGLAFDPALLRGEEMTEPFGARSVHELLDLPDPPTAFLASSIAIALGAARAIRAIADRIVSGPGARMRP